MPIDQQSPDPQIQTQRPIEFLSTSEEVAVGTVMGSVTGSGAALIFGGIVGAIGASIGNMFGMPTLVGSASIWLAFCVFPLVWLKASKPAWLFLAMITVGAAYLALLQWHIHQRDIGTFYPWSLSTLPFGIILGTFYEPIRLARGGSTEEYVARGSRNAKFLAVGFVLGLVADILSLGRHRAGATIGGLLGGALSALAVSSILAWRGDTSVADLFFGSVWNIAWAGTALGAVTGAASGFWAALIREQQEQRQRNMFESDKMLLEGASSDKVKEAK